MNIKITYTAKIPTSLFPSLEKEIKQDIFLYESNPKQDISTIANDYLSRYFTKNNFEIIELKVIDKD